MYNSDEINQALQMTGSGYQVPGMTAQQGMRLGYGNTDEFWKQQRQQEQAQHNRLGGLVGAALNVYTGGASGALGALGGKKEDQSAKYPGMAGAGYTDPSLNQPSAAEGVGAVPASGGSGGGGGSNVLGLIGKIFNFGG